MTEEKIKKVCEEAGVEYVGIQGIGEDGQFVLFKDMLTGSTLAVDKKKFTNPAIQAKVTVHRRQYPEELQMQSDIMDAIKFITRAKTLPTGVLMNASIAATLAITNYLKELKEQNNGREKTAA
jgi:hypothetical protein